MDDDGNDVQQSGDGVVAQLGHGLGHPNRVAVLRGIQQGRAMPAVADALDMSRSGLQTHIDVLVDAELVVRTGDQQDPYQVTVLGDLALEVVADIQDDAAAIADLRADAHEQAEQELEAAPLSDTEYDRAAQRRIWTLVADQFDDIDSD